MPLYGAAPPRGPQVVNKIIERAVRGHLCQILPVVGDLHRLWNPHFSSFERALTHERAQQRRFASTVRTDEANDVASADSRRESLHQYSLSDTDTNFLRHQHLVTAPRIRLQPEGHHSFLALGCAQPAHA